MMTEMQYFWGWIMYITGALGTLLALWFIIRKWHPRVKRSLMLIVTALLFVPWKIQPDYTFLGPALMVSMYDGLSQGVDTMWRSGWIVVASTIVVGVIGLLLPVKKRDKHNKLSVKKKTQNTEKTEN